MTETAELATLVLPAKGPFEKSGTAINVGGDLLPLEAATGLAVPEGALSDLEMIVRLAALLNVDLPSADELHARIIERAAAVPEYTLGDERFARIAQPARRQDGDLQVVLQSDIFAGGGTSAHDEAISGLRPLPQVALSPATAQNLGVATGDYVDLACGDRVLHDLLIEVRPRMRDGAAALIAGLCDDPANAFGDGAPARIENVRKAQQELLEEPV